MDPTDLGLFRLAEQRLAWTDQRQRVLAQNVANANTPGYVTRDIAPFATALAGQSITRTAPAHLASSTDGPGSAARIKPAARSPSGNGVSVEDQLARVADTASMQELTLNLHRRYQAMMRTAIGRAG